MRPPSLSRDSNRVTLKDASWRIRAAAIPDIPAPITITDGTDLCWLSMSDVIVPSRNLLGKKSLGSMNDEVKVELTM